MLRRRRGRIIRLIRVFKKQKDGQWCAGANVLQKGQHKFHPRRLHYGRRPSRIGQIFQEMRTPLDVRLALNPLRLRKTEPKDEKSSAQVKSQNNQILYTPMKI